MGREPPAEEEEVEEPEVLPAELAAAAVDDAPVEPAEPAVLPLVVTPAVPVAIMLELADLMEDRIADCEAEIAVPLLLRAVLLATPVTAVDALDRAALKEAALVASGTR